MSQNKNQKRLLVGKINGLFGVKGFVKVFSYTKPRDNIIKYKNWHLQKDDKIFTIVVENGRKQAKTIVAKLKDINTIEQANDFLGFDIYINKSELAKTKENEYYWSDIISLEVYNKEEKLGIVDYLIDTGANDVLVVKGDNKDEEVLIPFVAQFILDVSLEKQQILVDWEKDF